MKKLLQFACVAAIAGLVAVNRSGASVPLVSDNFNVTGSGSGFNLGSGINSGINPPTTRLTGPLAPGLRYINTGTKATSAYTITGNKAQITSAANPGRFVLSADGATSFDFGPALGINSASPAGPISYDLLISVKNASSGIQRCSFALGTAEGDATTWAFGFQIYRASSGNNFYTIGKRIDTSASGLASDLNEAVFTMPANTYGTEVSILMRVTDAGSESGTYNSRVQLSSNGGSTWFYDTATDPDLIHGWHLNGAGRHIMCDIAPSAGTVTYDNFSLNLYVPAHHVSAGIVDVVENDLANKTTSVNVTAANQINGFQVRDGSNRGDFNVQVGTDSTDDVATGVLLASVAENGRDNGEDSGINYCTAAINYARTGGSAGSYTLVAATAPSGKEYNINVAAAFFPYTNWLGGYARNSAGTLNGPDDLFTGSPGLALGTNFVDNGNGTYTIDLRNRGIDSRVDGVLLVCAGANDDDYALSSANTTDGTWNVWTKDNGTNGAVFEEDPVAFVFIPNTNSAVISGKFKGDGTILMHNGTSARFSVTNISTGMWQISIPGYSPQNGVLVISGENEDGAAQDNIVSSQPSGNNWIIESRDLPGLGLQTPADAVVSFVFIPSPAATLIAPANFATGISSTPGLTVNVTNNTPGNLSVTFVGREAPMPYPGPDFLMCVLPDTQNYARQASGIGHATKEMWFAQTDWIIANRDSANVAYVAQLGDIVQNGDVKNGSPNEGEWQIATNAMYRLEDQSQTLRLDGIPYGCSVGNHDQDPNGDEDGTTKLYNKYFGTSHYAGKSYYGGHYSTNGDSFFSLFSASGLDFIVFSYEFGRYGAGVLGWTEDVLATNQNRRVIVMTHYAGSDCGGTSCSLSPGGQAIYNELKIHTNFFLMMGGHVFNGNGDGEGSRSDTYNGATVHTLVSDYQGRTNGGDGLMRLMYFSPSNNTVSIKTYSPYTGKYETDANSQFSFHYNMQLPTGPGSPGTPYSVIGTNNGIAPGGQASFSWTGLQASKTYQWYVIVQNAAGDTYTSPVWQFSTSSGFSPSGLAQSKSMPEDPALATWQAEYGVSASSADDDHDGQSNYAEYLAGTNPTNAASLFRIVEGKMVNGKFRLRWTASGGKKYRIQYSDQLRGPFTDLVRDTASETAPGSSGEASIQAFTNSATGTNTSRYYRVKIVP